MPRKPRLFVSGATYHVYCRVARGEFVFDEPNEVAESWNPIGTRRPGIQRPHRRHRSHHLNHHPRQCVSAKSGTLAVLL